MIIVFVDDTKMIAKHGGKFRDRLQQAYDIAYPGYRYVTF